MSMSSAHSKDSFTKRLMLIFFALILILVLIGIGREAIASSASPDNQLQEDSYQEIDENFSENFKYITPPPSEGTD